MPDGDVADRTYVVGTLLGVSLLVCLSFRVVRLSMKRQPCLLRCEIRTGKFTFFDSSSRPFHFAPRSLPISPKVASGFSSLTTGCERGHDQPSTRETGSDGQEEKSLTLCSLQKIM